MDPSGASPNESRRTGQNSAGAFPCELSGRRTAIGGREGKTPRGRKPRLWVGNRRPIPEGTAANATFRGDNTAACGRQKTQRIFYQQRTGRKGHGSKSSQSEGPINIAARHTDVRWIAMPGPHGTMKPTKKTNQTKTQRNTTEKNSAEPPCHTTPLHHLLSTPESLPKTCRRILSVAVFPLIRTEHTLGNCLRSCSAVKTSLRISPSRGPVGHR